MEDTFVISKLEQLKVLADPLRQRLLNAFCCRPATTKQVADELAEKPTRLYHHVDLLQKAGLIELVETRQNRGTLEKYYLATARQFIVDHQLLRAEAGEEGSDPEAQVMLVNMLQATLGEAQQRFDADAVGPSSGKNSIVVGQAQLRLSEGQAQSFIDQLCGWLETCCDLEQSEDDQAYILSLAFFPVRVPTG